jgi:hypothetical protein
VRYLLAVLAGVTCTLTACSGPTPDERFAEDVCAATLPRAQELLETLEDARLTRAAPGLEARITLLALAMRGTAIASALRGELRAIEAPDSAAGREAAIYLRQFASTPLTTMTSAEESVRSLPESLTLIQSIRELNQLEFSLAQAFSETTTAQFVIMENVPRLREPFQEADECEELTALQIP